MKNEITFAQVAHLYLRSELKIWNRDLMHEQKRPVLMQAVGVYDHMIPVFTPFENLIKPVKSNKYVAELLDINEGDEYVMMQKLIELLCVGGKIKYCEKASDGNSIETFLKYDKGFSGQVILYKDFDIKVYVNFITNNICNQSFIRLLLIAAGYNVFGIKNCIYE